MTHEHHVSARYYAPNKVWVIEPTGNPDDEMFLYPNGTVKVGYDDDKEWNANDKSVRLNLVFE